YLQVMAMRPGQSSKDLERLRWFEGMARNAVKRRLSEVALVQGAQALPSVRTSGVDRTSKTNDLTAAVVLSMSRYRQNHIRTANAPNSHAPAARKGLMIVCPNRSHSNADNVKASVVTLATMSSQVAVEVGRSVAR